MEISPIRLLQLLISSFLFGVQMGVVSDAQYGIRLLLRLETMDLHMQRRYEKRIPLIHRNLRWRQITQRKRVIGGIFRVVQDFLFFAILGIGIVVLNYSYNDGKNRLFPFLGFFGGYLIYSVLIKRISRRLLQEGIFLFDLLSSWILYIILHPIVNVVAFIYGKVKKIFKNIKFSIAKRRKMEYNLYVRNYFYQRSLNGFLTDNKTKK